MHLSTLFTFFSTLGLALSASLPQNSSTTPTWRTLSSIPFFARQEHTTLFLPPSTVVILGGIIPTNDTSLNVETTNLMQFYSIPNDTWSTRAPFPRPLNHLNAAVVDGKIYVLGGLAEDESQGRAWRVVPDSWVYEPMTDTWTSLLGVPEGQWRGSAAVSVYDGKIFLAGGMTDLELTTRIQRTVAVVSIFDTVTSEWLKVPEQARRIPEGRDHAGGAVVDGKMFVLGGRDNGQVNVKDTVFVLDSCEVEKGWKVSEARMPTARGGIAAGTVGKKVYTFGGEGNRAIESGVFDAVEIYDTLKDRWENVGTMKVPRHGTYAVGARGKVYIPGGGISEGAGPVDHFDVFDL